MQNKSHAIAVIPARKGSKRLPGKNILPFAGKPLFVWTVEAALESGAFEEVIVSTDIPEAVDWINAHHTEYKTTLRAVNRPEKFAGDTATSMDVLKDLCQSENWIGTGVEEIWLLPPTSPFRNASHISQAKSELNDDWDAVISVTEFHIPVEWAFRMNENRGLTSVLGVGPLSTGLSRNQNYESAFHPNGAIYGSRLMHFMEKGNYYAGRIRGFSMARECSIDIDTQQDLILAEAMFKRGIP